MNPEPSAGLALLYFFFLTPGRLALICLSSARIHPSRVAGLCFWKERALSLLFVWHLEHYLFMFDTVFFLSSSASRTNETTNRQRFTAECSGVSCLFRRPPEQLLNHSTFKRPRTYMPVIGPGPKKPNKPTNQRAVQWKTNQKVNNDYSPTNTPSVHPQACKQPDAQDVRYSLHGIKTCLNIYYIRHKTPSQENNSPEYLFPLFCAQNGKMYISSCIFNNF